MDFIRLFILFRKIIFSFRIKQDTSSSSRSKKGITALFLGDTRDGNPGNKWIFLAEGNRTGDTVSRRMEKLKKLHNRREFPALHISVFSRAEFNYFPSVDETCFVLIERKLAGRFFFSIYSPSMIVRQCPEIKYPTPYFLWRKWSLGEEYLSIERVCSTLTRFLTCSTIYTITCLHYTKWIESLLQIALITLINI